MSNWLLSTFRRWPMWTFWAGMFVLGLLLAINNSLTTTDDLIRNGIEFKSWEPYCWELSSFLGIFLLFFGVYWLTNNRPLFCSQWPQNLLIHTAASMVFSLLHVLFMVLIRQLAYAAAGMSYDFGDWSSELIYEYRKDVVTYFVFVASFSGYLFMTQKLETQQPSAPEICFKNNAGLHRLLLSDISTIESGGNYIYFNVNGTVYPKRSTMKQMIDSLDSERFIRVHRSFIVNKDHIKALTELEKDPCTLVLNSGKTIPVSRKYRQMLINTMEKSS